MSSGLPVQIQVQKAVAKAMLLEGTLKLSGMSRLQQSLLSDKGEVNVQLEFGRGQDKRAYVRGHFTTDLVMQCQRCMGKMTYHLDTDTALHLVRADAEIEEDTESVEITDGQLLLHEFIEDELILALPVVPMHESASECEQSQMLLKYMEQPADSEQKENPFAVLKQLKPNSTSTR